MEVREKGVSNYHFPCNIYLKSGTCLAKIVEHIPNFLRHVLKK